MKTWLTIAAFCVGGVLAVVVGLPLLIKAIYFVQAPKYDVLSYNHTDRTYGCLAIITDATCDTTYYYTATGSEADLAHKLTAELEGGGYQPENGIETGSAFTCSQAGDTYSYDKRTGAQTVVLLFTFQGDRAGNDNSTSFGCDNPSSRFTVSLGELRD